jgi:hypothetical protein
MCGRAARVCARRDRVSRATAARSDGGALSAYIPISSSCITKVFIVILILTVAVTSSIRIKI